MKSLLTRLVCVGFPVLITPLLDLSKRSVLQWLAHVGLLFNRVGFDHFIVLHHLVPHQASGFVGAGIDKFLTIRVFTMYWTVKAMNPTTESCPWCTFSNIKNLPRLRVPKLHGGLLLGAQLAHPSPIRPVLS